jgi:hypothetical protein
VTFVRNQVTSSSEVIAAAGAGAYLSFVWAAILGLAGLTLLFNVMDVTYRLYQFMMERSPVGPGPGFRPFVLRISGAFVAIVGIVNCVRAAKGF